MSGPDLTTRNQPNIAYYQKRNNIKIAKNQESKGWIDPAVADGGGGVKLPGNPTAIWDATGLPLGDLSQWLSSDNRLVDDVSGNNFPMKVVDGPRGRGVEFDTANYNAGVGPYPQFNVQNNGNPSGITGGTLLMMFSMNDTWDSNYKCIMGNSGAIDRVNGARLDQQQARGRFNSSALPGRAIYNETVSTSGQPTWASLGISGASGQYLIAVRNLNLLMNRMGFHSDTVGNSQAMNGIIHEVVWYEDEISDADMDQAAEYLRAKWPLIETGGPPFADSLTNHYDAGVGVTLSGTDVIGWADQSGNGRDATFVAGTAPTQDGAFRNAIYGIDTGNNDVGLDVGGTPPATQEIKTLVVCLFWHTNASNGSGAYTGYQDLFGGTTLTVNTGDPEDDSRFTTFTGNSRWNGNPFLLLRHDDRAPVTPWLSHPNDIAVVTNGTPHVMSWMGGLNGVCSTYIPRLFNRGPGLDQNRGFRGGFYEILAYNFDLTDAQLDEVHQYLYDKWGVGAGTPPVTDGLTGWYGPDTGAFTVDGDGYVLTATNQANPGTYDATVGYVGGTGTGSRVKHENGYFYPEDSANRSIETPTSDYAAIEGEFQGGAYTHFHVINLTQNSTNENTGTGAGSKSTNWPETQACNNLEFTGGGSDVCVRGTAGGTGNAGSVNTTLTLGEWAVVAAVVEGPAVGAAAAIYLNGVVGETGTRSRLYIADPGETQDDQRSIMSIGRNRSGSAVGVQFKDAMYFNRALTAQEITDISNWLMSKHGIS